MIYSFFNIAEAKLVKFQGKLPIRPFLAPACFATALAFSSFFPSYAATPLPLELAGGLSFGSPIGSKDIEPYIGYQLWASFLPTERLSIGFGVSSASSISRYDLVGTIGEESILISTFQGSLGFRLADAMNLVAIDAVSRFGLMVLRSDSRRISAGGFGNITIPGRSERLFVTSFGLTASKRLFSRVSVFVFPQVVIVAPIQLRSAGYSIEGGLSIGIL